MIQPQYFDFYSVGVRLRYRAGSRSSFRNIFSDVRKRIEEDFRFFSVSRCSILIDVQIFPIKALKNIKFNLTRMFRARMCTAYGFFGARLCDYGEDLKVYVRFQRGVRKIYLFGDAEDPLAEVALVALLSAVGEELDALGLHRVHALAFERDGSSYLMPLRSGSGKSSIAVQMLRDWRYRIFSDEIPLLISRSNNTSSPGLGLTAFPLRIALLPVVAEKLGLSRTGMRVFKRRIFPEKILFPIPESKVAASARPRYLLLSAHGRLRLLMEIVLGWGVPQFAEYMIRLDNLPGLAWIAVSRFIMALRLLASLEKIDFDLSKDPLENKAKIDSLF